MKLKKKLKTLIKVLVFTVLAIFLLYVVFNITVVLKGGSKIYSLNDFIDRNDDSYDAILVLGCGVWDNRPSPMLADRIYTGVELYKAGCAPKIIMSGDHGRENYDEVNVMKNYAINLGVPEEDIFLDHAGFSTYESMYRADYIFECSKMIVVTQEYHLYRACFDSMSFGIDTVGVIAESMPFAAQPYYSLRETIARSKDFLFCIFKPKPTYLGDKIDITGDGRATAG